MYLRKHQTASGIEDEQAGSLVRAFPNPTTATTTLEFTLPAIAPVTIEITASNGAQVQTLEFMPSSLNFRESISLKEVANGAYVLTITSGTRTWVQKVVKE